MPNFISAFSYRDIPVSFVESYSGEFDEVFARVENGDAVGFIKTLGKGKVMMFGAAMITETLEDLDVVHQMALKMGCPAPFKLGDWADVRISRGEKGSFLFINNYQDDPVELTIRYQGKQLQKADPVCLFGRRGAILPLEWQVTPGIQLHYATSEIINRMEMDGKLVLETELPEIEAEVSLQGYKVDPSMEAQPMENGRFRIIGRNGEIILWKSQAE